MIDPTNCYVLLIPCHNIPNGDSPYPEVTLDTFGFPVGGRLPKMVLFGAKNAYYSIVSHGIELYLWYCIVLHVIAKMGTTNILYFPPQNQCSNAI